MTLCSSNARRGTTISACSARPTRRCSGAPRLPGMIGNQYRMSEFTGGVLLAQLRKVDTILAGFRRHARRVYEEIADLPGLCLRTSSRPRGRYRLEHLARLPFAGSSRPIPQGDECRERAGVVPAGSGPHPDPARGRAETDGPPGMALVHQREGPGDPVRCGVLPPDDRHPSAFRRHLTRSEVLEPRCRRHHRGHPQGLPRSLAGVIHSQALHLPEIVRRGSKLESPSLCTGPRVEVDSITDDGWTGTETFGRPRGRGRETRAQPRFATRRARCRRPGIVPVVTYDQDV